MFRKKLVKFLHFQNGLMLECCYAHRKNKCVPIFSVLSNNGVAAPLFILSGKLPFFAAVYSFPRSWPFFPKFWKYLYSLWFSFLFTVTGFKSTSLTKQHFLSRNRANLESSPTQSDFLYPIFYICDVPWRIINIPLWKYSYCKLPCCPVYIV